MSCAFKISVVISAYIIVSIIGAYFISITFALLVGIIVRAILMGGT